MSAPVTHGVDSHVHVYDVQRFPLTAKGQYVPQDNELATPEDFGIVLDYHGLTHGVLVNPLPGYAYDNRCMLDAIGRSGGRFKGVARIEPTIGDAELEAMAAAGVVGARFSLPSPPGWSLGDRAGRALLGRMRELGMFAQIYGHDDKLLELLPPAIEAGIPIVVDHCGCPDPSRGLDQPGFKALLDLGRRGKAAVKLSGPFRYSRERWPYADCDRFIAALLDAFTADNCVWGSDWPWVHLFKRKDYGPEFSLLERWAPDPAVRGRILWDAPKRWFRFA